MPSRLRLVPTIAPSATARQAATVSAVTPVLARTGTPGAAAFASRSWARSVGSPVMAPLTSRASTPRKAALRARCAMVRLAIELANSGVMLENSATGSRSPGPEPMPDR